MSGIPDDLVMLTMGGLLEEIQSAYPQIDGTRDMADDVIVHHGADIFSQHIERVDANFLSFFPDTGPARQQGWRLGRPVINRAERHHRA